jgi:hypothetical protein
MTDISTLRRHIVAALLIAAVLTIAPASLARAAVQGTRYQVPAKICDIDWRKGTWQVKQLIRCAADYWHVRGGADTALAIADRESQFRPNAYNASGCAGIYQHMLEYWPGRASAYGFPGWSAFNARANIIVTIKMVKQGGWGPWT